jgi:hypothetical protein
MQVRLKGAHTPKSLKQCIVWQTIWFRSEDILQAGWKWNLKLRQASVLPPAAIFCSSSHVHTPIDTTRPCICHLHPLSQVDVVLVWSCKYGTFVLRPPEDGMSRAADAWLSSVFLAVLFDLDDTQEVDPLCILVWNSESSIDGKSRAKLGGLTNLMWRLSGNSKFLPNSWKNVFSYGRKFKPTSQWVTHLIIQKK